MGLEKPKDHFTSTHKLNTLAYVFSYHNLSNYGTTKFNING